MAAGWNERGRSQSELSKEDTQTQGTEIISEQSRQCPGQGFYTHSPMFFFFFKEAFYTYRKCWVTKHLGTYCPMIRNLTSEVHLNLPVTNKVRRVAASWGEGGKSMGFILSMNLFMLPNVTYITWHKW